MTSETCGSRVVRYCRDSEEVHCSNYITRLVTTSQLFPLSYRGNTSYLILNNALWHACFTISSYPTQLNRSYYCPSYFCHCTLLILSLWKVGRPILDQFDVGSQTFLQVTSWSQRDLLNVRANAILSQSTVICYRRNTIDTLTSVVRPRLLRRYFIKFIFTLCILLLR